MKNKGFTLIELLAVIVILAVIALIATPMVLNVIENAKKGAAESSVNGYLKALEIYITSSNIEPGGTIVPNQKYNLTKPTIIDGKTVLAINDLVDVKGSKPIGLDDYILLDEKYIVKEGKISISGYNIEVKDGKVISTIKGDKIEVKDITLNITNETMERGSTITIVPTFEPINASIQEVIYESKDTNIVTVDDNGKIVAVGNGSTKVIVTSKDNKNVKKEVTITVISPSDVTGLILEKVEEKDLYVGETLQLRGIIEPSDATMNSLEWTSSNEEVATVSDSGLITGISAGTTTIKAKTKSNIEATLEIEVKEVLAENITISGESEVVAGSTITLTATILPSNTTNKNITWTSSDTSIATVTNGVVTGVSVGTVTITAKTSNNKEATKTIIVNPAVYKENLLNGTDPVLKGNLIPVTISNTGIVTYADVYKEWYNYEKKVWANAVILVDSPSKTYSVGNTILESDIESYFVWIPKYRYRLKNLGNYDSETNIESKESSFDITFGKMNTWDNGVSMCEIPIYSGTTGNCKVGYTATHPAFISLGVNGIWVGKFETTGSISQLTIKPNNTSIDTTFGVMFDSALNYENTLNSHMMKNTEWGAVAYLSHSQYGINAEITINNCSSNITGIGGDSVSASSSYTTCTTAANQWNGAKGVLASTTGNISGIYDMVGGLSEIMAAYIKDNYDNNYQTKDRINAYPKYLDAYKNSSSVHLYKNRILGDATGEMGPFYGNRGSWYGDWAMFVSPSTSFFVRGGNYLNNDIAGIFAFQTANIGGFGLNGFRLVLAP